MNFFNTKLLPTLPILAGLVCATSSLVMTTSAYAHGTVVSPPSRVYNCYKENPENPSSEACKAATAQGKQQFYDWNGVRLGDAADNHQDAIPDGKLCSAGAGGGLDLPRSDWISTHVKPGNFVFKWKNSAPHATQYYRYYITRDGYDPTKPLNWGDLDEFCTYGKSAGGSEASHSCTLPVLSGKHVVYSVWQRSDSPEAFYACIDIDFEGGKPATPIPPVNPSSPKPPVASCTPVDSDGGGSSSNQNTCTGLKHWNAHTTYVKGDMVIAGDSRYEAKWWSFAKDPGKFSGPGQMWINHKACAGKIPAGPEISQCKGLDVWNKSYIYSAGQRVAHKGVAYKAAFYSRGRDPETNSGSDQPWINQNDCTGKTPVNSIPNKCKGTNNWNISSIYYEGDQVAYKGFVYVAKWWSQGDDPDIYSNQWDVWSKGDACK